MRQCEGVQDGIGRATHRHVQRKRIVDCLRGHNVAGLEIQVDQVHDLPAGCPRQLLAAGIDGQDRAVARQGHAERFAEAVHRVGSEHARARTTGRATCPLEVAELLVSDLARLIGADPLEDRDKVHHLARGGDTRLHRAAADENGRDV